MSNAEFDDVQRPKHYNAHPSGIECVVINEHFSGNLAAAIKYLWRKDLKEPLPLRDLQKAEWYLKREIARTAQEGEWAQCCLTSRPSHLKENMERVGAANPGLLSAVLTALVGVLGNSPLGIVAALSQALGLVQGAIRHRSSGPE